MHGGNLMKINRMRLLIFFLLLSLHARSHPGPGIVKDSRGSIYYTDLQQVWKIEPGRKPRVILKNIHTHELCLDAQDNLYGEHSWYNGERLNTWGHFAWKLQANGRLDTVVGPEAGFLSGYSFVRDASGSMYWTTRFDSVTRFHKRLPDGKVTTIGEGRYGHVKWMHATPDGSLFFTHEKYLFRIIPGHQPSLFAGGLYSECDPKKRHSLFGIWSDKNQNLYVADHTAGTVKKITPSGKVTTFLRTTAPWSPVSGVFDDEGHLWLMEYSVANEVRVRRITDHRPPLTGEGQAVTNKREQKFFLPALPVMVILIAIIWISVRRIMS
jgi:hypothetical protein